MNVAVCCIGRMENRYAVEFVEHYKKIGFDKIFIYDNNFDGEEYFQDVLQPYIDDGFVEVIDYRNKEVCQLEAYTDCYVKHNKEYDWIAFLDFDEFIHIVNGLSIKRFLCRKPFKSVQCIYLNWMMYGDNGLVYYEYKPLAERFKEPLPYDSCLQYEFPENNHVKSIIKGGIENFKWEGNPHTPNIDMKCCDCDGVECEVSPFKPYNFNKCYIKHYFTKTIDEWLNNKYERQYCDQPHRYIEPIKFINKFFKLNERTEEKEDFVKNFLKDNERNDNVDIFICTHKDFVPKVTNQVYKTIDVRNIPSDEYGLDNKFYSELSAFFEVAKSDNLKDYVGFCHYRRYMDFMDNIPNMDNIFSEYDVVAGEPINIGDTVYGQYNKFHNIEDLYIITAIMALKYPTLSKIWGDFVNGNMMIPYNMFIMKRDDFIEYISFIKEILNEYIEIVGSDIYKRIGNNIEKYVKDFYPNNSIDYQYRIGGYLGERLTSFFLMFRFKKILTYPIIITEEKYKSYE